MGMLMLINISDDTNLKGITNILIKIIQIPKNPQSIDT